MSELKQHCACDHSTGRSCCSMQHPKETVSCVMNKLLSNDVAVMLEDGLDGRLVMQ